MKIGIIGGGASAMMSAILLKRRGNDVTLIEKNTSLGKKILITGAGRCNYFNTEINLDKYYTSDKKLLKEIIKEENITKTNDFFTSIGIIPRIKNGYYYPASNSATSILNALVVEIKNIGVSVLLDTLVTDIKKKQKEKKIYYQVITNKEILTFDKLIIAVGSSAGSKEEMNIYSVLNSLNHKINPIYPALVPLITKGAFLKKWSGIRTMARVSLFEEGKKLKEELGEIQLTDYGISGICVMNLSSLVSRGLALGKKESIHINFLPEIDSNQVQNFLENRSKILPNRTIIELLETIIPYKLLYIIMNECKINNNCHYKSLTTLEKEILIKNISDFTIPILATKEMYKAQVATGGIPLEELTNHLESKYNEGLYFTGEIIDVDGICGGYNLGFAWLSSIAVSEAINDKN